MQLVEEISCFFFLLLFLIIFGWGLADYEGDSPDRTVAQDQKRLMEIRDLECLTVQTDESKVSWQLCNSPQIEKTSGVLHRDPPKPDHRILDPTAFKKFYWGEFEA